MASKEEHVLETAFNIFYKHGYNRVTVNEIAEAAGISRPALYLLFNSKEQIFNAAIKRNVEVLLADIRTQIAEIDDPSIAIRKAINLWAIQYFDRNRDSPEAREITEASKEISKDINEFAAEKFELILSELIPNTREYSASEIAHIVNYSIKGLKQTATNGKELQELVEHLLILLNL